MVSYCKNCDRKKVFKEGNTENNFALTCSNCNYQKFDNSNEWNVNLI